MIMADPFANPQSAGIVVIVPVKDGMICSTVIVSVTTQDDPVTDTLTIYCPGARFETCSPTNPFDH